VDTDTAAELYLSRLRLSPEAVAIEAVALRAMIDRLIDNLDILYAHIIDVTNPKDALHLARSAGGLAVINMINGWVLEYVANLNDVCAEAIKDAS